MSPDVEPTRSERVAVRLQPDVKVKAAEAARKEDVTLSKWVERLVRDAVKGKLN